MELVTIFFKGQVFSIIAVKNVLGLKVLCPKQGFQTDYSHFLMIVLYYNEQNEVYE